MYKPSSPPDVRIGGLRIWVYSIDAEGWLSITAHFGWNGADVWTYGAILMRDQLECLRAGCAAIRDGRGQAASTGEIEPELSISLNVADKLGHLTLTVQITPDHLEQEHTFRLEIDQTDLPPFLADIDRLLARFADPGSA
ncbi:MAG: hypothetical protein HYR85_11505 [Planctomycetes bacterium]|nr:hypothetical protein [Planctomycetota bacterium]MBI3845613.1 hypothetical protein [Planctomycetota bacterium]